MHIRHRLAVILAVLLLLHVAFAALPAPRLLADGGSPEERALREAISTLGWPDTVTRGRLYELEPDDETLFVLWPPGAAYRYLLRPKVSANNGGSYDEETIQYARILALGEDGGRYYIDKMLENGFPHSSYQGREGIVMRAGHQLCETGGLLGFLVDIIREAIVSFLAELGVEDTGEPLCAEAAAGVIIWTCGSHTFVVRDDTATGAEDQIAAALYMAAQNQGLCDLGDTLVILAATADRAGTRPLSYYQEMAQNVNSYFGQNAYGRVVLSYTFMDADGDAGSGPGDWYVLEGNLADYRGNNRRFVTEAIEAAFAAGAPADELNLARVIAVFPGRSRGQDSTAPLGAVCSWPNDGRWFEIAVGPEDQRATVYASSLIAVAEESALGTWAHEVGHSLYSRHTIHGWRARRIGDRYNYDNPAQQYGAVDNWGLMGSGNWWGEPSGTAPVHMIGFTKEGAGWLTYQSVELGQRYTLTAIEHLSHGGAILQIDDPLSNHPEHYFVIEARDASAPYGAPETGVVVYQVRYQSGSQHHIVNDMSAQTGTTRGTGPGGRAYWRPTLRGAGAENAPTVWRSPQRRLEITLHEERHSPHYQAVVSVSTYTPTNLLGATVAPSGQPAVTPPGGGTPGTDAPGAPCGLDGPMPDIDLHAYDEQGRHVGWNHVTGEYENQIPGAIASGDLKDAPEWIFVPEGTPVRFEVTAVKTAMYLEANPHYAQYARPQEYETTFMRIDEHGEITEAVAKKAAVEAGGSEALPDPDDPSLHYRPARYPGYGRNITAGTYLTLLLVALAAMGLVGWVIGLVRVRRS